MIVSKLKMKNHPSYCAFLIILFSLNYTGLTNAADEVTVVEKTEIVKKAEKTEITPEELLLESKTLFSKIDYLSKRTKSLRAKMNKTADTDRFLFINLIGTIEGKIREKLDRLIDIKRIFDKQQDASIHLNVSEIEIIVKRQSVKLQSQIKVISKIALQLRNKNNKNDALLFAIGRTEKEVDSLFIEWHKNIQRGKELKLDMTEENSQLTELIQFRSIGFSGQIRVMLDVISILKDRLSNAAVEQKNEINQQLYILELRKAGAATHLEAMVGLMNKQGLKTTEFGKVLIVATGLILSENVTTDAVVGIFHSTIKDALGWWKNNLPMVLFKIVSFIVVLLVFKLIARIVSRFVNRLTIDATDQSSQLLNNFFRSIASKTVMLTGFAVALSQLGIEIGPILAGMGVMGFVIGFALQDTLSNFAAGMMLLIYRPYDVGDFLQVASISGEVKEMNLVSTTILTIDHQRMVIPNSKIWGDIITNVTAEQKRRVDMVFGIGYTDSIEKAEAVFKKMMDEHPLILDEPQPLIKVHTLGSSSVDFIVRPWVNTKDYWSVYWDITRQVKEEFDLAGISIPFPQQDVHLYSASDKKADSIQVR